MKITKPIGIEDFKDFVIARHLPAARKAVAERNRQIDAVNDKIKPLAQARDMHQKQLDDARAGYDAQATTGTASELAQLQIIIQHWPGRINELQNQINELQQSKRDFEQACNYQINHVRAEIELDFLEAKKQLTPPNIWNLI